MFEEWVESECLRHGLKRHIEIHEAGHAVAAIDHAIPFRDVEVFADSEGPRFQGGLRQAAAEVNMRSGDPADWVLPNRIAALRFVLAGSIAEVMLLEHAVRGGFDGDLRVWRIGVGSTGALQPKELDDVVGAPFLHVAEGVKAWAAVEADRITRFADHLAALKAPALATYEDAIRSI